MDDDMNKVYSGGVLLKTERIIQVLAYLRRLINSEFVDDDPKGATMTI